MSEMEKLQEEINFLKKKLIKSEKDLQGSLEQVANFQKKYEKVTSYNEELESQLKKLSQEIQLYRSKERDGVSVGIQVSDSDPELVSSKVVVKTETETVSSDVDMAPSVAVSVKAEVEPMSIAESLKAAAEEVVQNSGYVFDEKSGMYYDYNTGYYYDNEKALYYDPASGTYFYYDHAASEYKFHSQVSTHQYTTDSRYTDLDAANDGRDDSSWKADGRERDSLNSKSRHRKKTDVPEEEEWNGREHRHKHKKKKSHKRDGEKEKHKKKKKRRERDEDDETRRKRKKRKREKDDKDEKSLESKKKRTKREKNSDKNKEKDKQDKVVGDGSSDSRNDNDKNDAGMAGPKIEECATDDTKGKSKDKEFGRCKLNNSDKGADSISKKAGKDGHDYKDCDIFEEIVPKKERKPEMMMVEEAVHDSSKRNGKAPEINMKEMELIEISSSESDLEEGEISDISTISSSSSSSSLSSEEESEIELDPPIIVEEENSKAWPPCIRAMVKSSDKLDRGSLFLVTCTGATIGREKDLGHTILIDDVLISKMHAELKYNEEFKRYVVIDHASQNGTFVNGDRVCEPKVMGEPKTLFHGDELRVGGTTLELHIHPGTDTCEGCEPGLVLAQIKQEERLGAVDAKVVGKEEKESLRRKQLKNIKRKFGLENVNYVDDVSAINNPKYQDKATERRKTKGSDNPYQKDDAPASVDRAISHENKGRKLLQKMGWTEGESLGKSRQKGLKEPIKVNIRSTPQAGLGSGLNIATSLDNVHDVKKRELWSKMQQRYTNIDSQKKPAPVHVPGRARGGWVSGGVVMDPPIGDSETETIAQPKDVSGDVVLDTGAKELGVQAGASGVLENQETDILYL